jgi:transcription-repair coupling factor (superfamily II helicase)
MIDLEDLRTARAPLRVGGAPAGALPRLLADLARLAATDGRRAVLVTADDSAGRAVVDNAPFFAPEAEILWLPAWDCLPYDRASPAQGVMAERLAALARLAEPVSRPQMLVTTSAAATQRLLSPEALAEGSAALGQGVRIGRDSLVQQLARAGYTRAETVAQPGDYAVRGSLVDLVPPGERVGLRLDFFGDELESIREVDLVTQRTTGRRDRLRLLPVSELLLDEARIRRFRRAWLEMFGAEASADPLYQAISQGRRIAGAEHALPLAEPRLCTLFDWLDKGDLILLDGGARAAAAERFEAIADYHANRVAALEEAGRRRGAGQGVAWRPLPPEALYLSPADFEAQLSAWPAHETSPFVPQTAGAIDLGARPGPDFAAERQAAAAGGPTIYSAIATRLADAAAQRRGILLASYSAGARERLAGLLAEAGAPPIVPVGGLQEALGLAASGQVGSAVLPLARGVRMPDLEIWTEQDLLGDRMVRRRSARQADAFLKELETLSPGELVVHQEHGIGRFLGLEGLSVSGARHDMVAVEYAGGDRLYVPVENVDLLSRYGSESEGVALDRLGGASWKERRARLKNRIRDLAHELLRVAALRRTRPADALVPDPAGYAAFVDRFPYAETEDQLRATSEVLKDLASGRPMDRLVCGDVGFGKTEVALRAAFAAASAGAQVAVICPTTLLARQHAEAFRERFRGLPLSIGALSRLVPAGEARRVREGLESGAIDIVIGTHALLAKGIRFARLGLVIVDEEQRFGVAHKERLKAMRADVHMLTLTATPIPRTLQMALSGLRELSVIATPPVDRLAVRTSVSPWDPVVAREALLREHHRGGQSFLVTPRIAELGELEQFLREQVPEIRFVTAHGQMAPSELEDRMGAFYEQGHDVLLSTTIIESGLDIPNANTLIVHRADMFGLAQLYQLRGRVGRAKRRAYALLMTPADGRMTEAAHRRLQVLAGLDSLGAGFQLAAQDLDIRGAGNLLGEEQSGHIREVGFELYQSMLEDAILAARAETEGLVPPRDPLSPTISVDAPVLVPETYVPDLALRMALYRRAAELADEPAIEAFAAELIDRFGALPEETANLLKVVRIKQIARKAHVARIEMGPRGALVTFAEAGFPDVPALLSWIGRMKGAARLRPDDRLFVSRPLPTPEARLAGALAVAKALAAALPREAAASSPRPDGPQARQASAPAPFRARARR